MPGASFEVHVLFDTCDMSGKLVERHYSDVKVIQEHRFAQGGEDCILIIQADGTKITLVLGKILEFRMKQVGGGPGIQLGGSWSGSSSAN